MAPASASALLMRSSPGMPTARSSRPSPSKYVFFAESARRPAHEVDELFVWHADDEIYGVCVAGTHRGRRAPSPSRGDRFTWPCR